jgi:spoIIIJ-associated protein
MEWVEVTAKTVEEAKHQALDKLGVAVDDAEFDVLQQPSKGLFGLLRGEARVRARVRPTAVRPKRDRRERAKGRDRDTTPRDRESAAEGDDDAVAGEPAVAVGDRDRSRNERRPRTRGGQTRPERGNGRSPKQQKETKVDHDPIERSGRSDDAEPVDPSAVGEAAAAFVTGLATALGSTATAEVVVDGSDLEVRLTGADLGLLIGPGGRTLTAVQDLARVAAQRKLGDHETRLKIDVAGYREKRREALEKFARTVADDVLASGQAKALEPMSSADRKVVHDTITEIDGVVSRSDGDDPARRVVISPG